MSEKHSPLLPEDADERRMWNDSKEAIGVTDLQRVGMLLHTASQMAPKGGSYREVMAIAYNEVTKADAIVRSVNGLPEAIAALEEIASWRDDTLGPRPKERGPYDCAPEITAAFDNGARMAFYRCADRARAALKG